jgi:hypothetical protein
LSTDDKPEGSRRNDMSDENSYIIEIEEQLESWHHEIYKFRIITEEIGEEEPDRQIKYYQVIEDIVAKEKSVAEKLSDLKDSGEKERQQLKSEIEALREHIEHAIESARTVVN